MSQLVISNNSAQNPQSIDLTAYMDVNQSEMDVSDPAFTNRVWSRSLLKHGATLALEQLVEKELTFPLKIGPIGGVAGSPTTLSQTLQFVQNVNMILETPGATVTWQPVGASQATTFDLLSGQLEIAYNYRAEQQRWTFGNLRLFTQPLGRTAAPRPYAAASGVGPLLMISPYASGGALATVPSATGFGASGGVFGPNGASGGISYFGSPSLAGDAPVQLQISYVGPLPNTATMTGVLPYVAVSVLPDALYRPLITAPEISVLSASRTTQAGAVASSYLALFQPNPANNVDIYSFSPVAQASYAAQEVAVNWAGQHRLLAIARASARTGWLTTQAGPLVSYPTSATVVGPADWGIYDLGTFSLRPSQFPSSKVVVQANCPQFGHLDLTAFIMLPDNATWFLSPNQLQASQYGYPPAVAAAAAITIPSAPWSNTLLLDDILGDQFIYSGQSQSFAPSPIGAAASSGRISQWTRGLVPQPDPKNGLPIVAIVGMGQASDVALPSFNVPLVNGATQANPQNLGTFAQVTVLEKARFVLP